MDPCRLYKNINAAEITHVFRLIEGKKIEFVKEIVEGAGKPQQDEGLEWDEEE